LPPLKAVLIFLENDLPDSNCKSPLVNTLEITAAYWEARIKTYGFHRVTDLSLFELDVESSKMSVLGHTLCRMGEEGIPLVLAFSWITLREFSACFVVPRLFEGTTRDLLRRAVNSCSEGIARRDLPVEVVYFYGPHFGDRYGIAEAALRALAGSGIQTTATVCSGSCVYLVLPDGGSGEAVRVLSETFEIPRASSQRQLGVNRA
jgi:aspartokinase